MKMLILIHTLTSQMQSDPSFAAVTSLVPAAANLICVTASPCIGCSVHSPGRVRGKGKAWTPPTVLPENRNLRRGVFIGNK